MYSWFRGFGVTLPGTTCGEWAVPAWDSSLSMQDWRLPATCLSLLAMCSWDPSQPLLWSLQVQSSLCRGSFLSLSLLIQPLVDGFAKDGKVSLIITRGESDWELGGRTQAGQSEV